MVHPSPHLAAFPDWATSLERSKAQIAAGEVVPLLPVLDQLRDAAEALEARLQQDPDGPPASSRP